MTDEQIIELMARAILDDGLWLGAWAKANEVERSDARHKARAALTALRSAGMAVVPREPTATILEAGNLPLGCRRDCNLGLIRAASVYTAMINTAEGKTE